MLEYTSGFRILYSEDNKISIFQTKTKKPALQIALICLAHFINDIHLSFLPTFIPGIVEKLGISLAQAGLLNSISGFINMVGQPLFGYLADKTTSPRYMISGPVLACLGATLLPMAPNYLTALVFVLIWGIGTAVYHPQGSGSIGHLCSEVTLSSSLAFFGFGGMLAGALSPLYAVSLVKIFNYYWMPVVAMVPVLITVGLIYYYIPSIQDGIDFKPTTGGFFRNFWDVFRVVYRIWIVAFLRAVTGQGLRFFLPLVIAARGGSLVTIGTVLFIITIGSSISPIICGKMADLFGPKKALIVLLVIIPFLLVPAALTQGVVSIGLYMAGYALLTATEPITNAMAQRMAPHARGMASSIIMGFAFGFGGVFTVFLGAIADNFGLPVIMILMGVIPSIALPVIVSRKWD